MSYATDGDAITLISLPTRSFIILAFSMGSLFDGPGDDLIFREVGDDGDTADVVVSGDFGATFTLIGQAGANGESRFDLGATGFTGLVNAIKIVGLDDFGGAPGFNLAYVRASNDSFAPIPLPPALPFLGAGLLALGLVGRRRRAP